MIVVHKVKITAHTFTALPIDAEFLHAAEQHGGICVWYKHDTLESRMVTREFVIVGTGKPLPPQEWLYIGTVLQADDTLVWHVFVDKR